MLTKTQNLSSGCQAFQIKSAVKAFLGYILHVPIKCIQKHTKGFNKYPLKLEMIYALIDVTKYSYQHSELKKNFNSTKLPKIS